MVSGCVSAATWLDLNESEKGSSKLESYVLFWLGFLSSMLVLGPDSGGGALMIAGFGIYRLQDLVFASLDNVFGLTKRGNTWKRRSGVGPVVIALWNIVQVILIFALLYQNLAGGGRPGVFEAPSRPAVELSGWFSFLYLSWTTLFPPGSGYTPASTTARVLVMAESGSGLLIIGLTLAALISGIDKRQRRSMRPPPPPPPSIGIREIRDIAIIGFFSLGAGVVAGFTVGLLVGMLTSG
jgi:hypothetical protein